MNARQAGPIRTACVAGKFSASNVVCYETQISPQTFTLFRSAGVQSESRSRVEVHQHESRCWFDVEERTYGEIQDRAD